MTVDFDPTAYEHEIAAEIGTQQSSPEDESGTTDAAKNAYKQQPFRQAQLLVIDCHALRPLFAATDSPNAISWKTLIEAITNNTKSTIISNENDKWGLLLYGTEKSDNQYKMQHIIELLPMDFLTPQSIKALQALSKLDMTAFYREYGSLSDVKAVSHRQAASAAPMSLVFRYALRAFRTAAPMFRFARKLLIFTHRPDPCANLPQDRSVATQLGLDLVNNNVVIDLFPLSLTGQRNQFDLSSFYGPILSASARQGMANLFEGTAEEYDDQVVTEQTSLSMLSEFNTELRRRVVQTRVLQKVELKVAPDMVIALAVFLVIGEAKKPTPVLLKADNHKPLYSETVYIDSTTGNLLARDEMRKYFDFDGLRINYTDEELDLLKSVQTRPRYEAFPGQEEGSHRMTILGYKPVTHLERWRFSVRMQVHYLFPAETEIQGSSKLFRSLVQSMNNLRRIAIIAWQFRANAAPRLFAGIPQVGHDGLGKPQIGLYLIALPFADDIRSIKVSQAVSPEAVNTAYETLGTKLVGLLEKIDLVKREAKQVDHVSNPALARHFAGLEALALGAEEIPDVKDETEPDSVFFESLKDELCALQEAFGLRRGQKRSASSTRSEGSSVQVDMDHVRSLAESGKLTTLTVPQLKSALTTLGSQVSGRKAELIERLTTHFKAKDK